MRVRSFLLAATLAAPLAPAPGLARELKRPGPVADPACARHGPGFVAVAGSSTCVRLSGRVGAESTIVRGGAPDSSDRFRGNARVSVDARTETSLGPVRTFVRVGPGSR